MITNEEGMAEGVEYLSPLGKSDHRVINFNLKCYIQQTKRIKEIYYHGKGNNTNMGLELMKINWNEELGNREEDVNYQWHFIKEKIELAMEKHVLKWKIKIGHTKHKCKLQHKCKLNNEIRELIRRKHKAWQRYAESHYTDENKHDVPKTKKQSEESNKIPPKKGRKGKLQMSQIQSKEVLAVCKHENKDNIRNSRP